MKDFGDNDKFFCFEALLEQESTLDKFWDKMEVPETLPDMSQKYPEQSVQAYLLAQQSQYEAEQLLKKFTEKDEKLALASDVLIDLERDCFYDKTPPDKAKKVVFEDDPNHKYFPEVNLFVPREGFIQAELAKFLAPIEKQRNIKVNGYQGSANAQLPEQDKYRHQEYLRIRKLTLFSSYPLYDMKKGHQSFWLKKRVERCLTLSFADAGVVGAIYFEINFLTSCNKCFIRRLEIDNLYQRNHFGSILLQATILIALLYECEEVLLIPSENAKSFYKSHGFSNDSLVGLGLNFKRKAACQLLMNRVKQNSPHYPLDSLLEQVWDESVFKKKL